MIRDREQRESESGVTPISPLTDLVTVSEAASALRVSRRTIERLAAKGVLPFFALPVRGGIRFDRASLLAFLASRYRESLGTQ
jgi:excisionase family DNA binding protein